jgi:hypothetical protein
MKKTFVISLILVGAFLIASSGEAFITDECQEYQCSTIEGQNGELYYYGEACVELCPDYPAYPNVLSGLLSGDWIECYLYPTPGSKNLLGTANTNYGWGGCSVELRGRSMTSKITYIQEGEGYVDTMKCVPCDNCCVFPNE